jgi:hypothetical protein
MLSSSGFLGINTTSPTQYLDVDGGIGAESERFLYDIRYRSLTVGDVAVTSTPITSQILPGVTSILPNRDAVSHTGQTYNYQGTVLDNQLSLTALSRGQLVVLENGGSWGLADADSATSTRDCLGIVLNAAAGVGSDISVLLEGVVSTNFADGITVGEPAYVGVTAGNVTGTVPTGAADAIRGVGWFLANNAGTATLFFKPDNAYFVNG